MWEDDELKVAVDINFIEGIDFLQDDELAEEMDMDCVDTITDERLVAEAIALTGEVDELKVAVDIYLDEGTAVLPDDELAENPAIDCVDTIADEGLVMEAIELTGKVGADLIEVFDGLVAQEESLR